MHERILEAVDKLAVEVQLTSQELLPTLDGKIVLTEDTLSLTIATYILARLAIRLSPPDGSRDLNSLATIAETSAAALMGERLREIRKQLK